MIEIDETANSPEITSFMGRNIDEMSREKLIVGIRILGLAFIRSVEARNTTAMFAEKFRQTRAA